MGGRVVVEEVQSTRVHKTSWSENNLWRRSLSALLETIFALNHKAQRYKYENISSRRAGLGDKKVSVERKLSTGRDDYSCFSGCNGGGGGHLHTLSLFMSLCHIPSLYGQISLLFCTCSHVFACLMCLMGIGSLCGH